MDYIEFLGTSGTKTACAGTTCLRVSKTCVIDAGNLIEGTGEGLFLIEHIFLTHSHLDHIVDIAFMADLFVTQKKSPLKIYGLKETLDNLRHFIFNHQIWPNFEEITLIQQDAKTIELIEICLDTPYSVDDLILTPFKTNHTDGSCGYVIEQNGNAIMFTSDTYKCTRIWELMEKYPHIHSLVIDVSFPSSYQKLASDSKHMTPEILAQELSQCTRKDFKVFPMHLKSMFETIIKTELHDFGILNRGGHVLESYECLSYDPDTVLEKPLRCRRIYDQIHAIEMRFEVLKRDAYILFLEQKSTMDDPKLLHDIEKNYNEMLTTLNEEINFLKTAHSQGKFVSDDHVQRVHSIAQRKIRIDGVFRPLLNEDEVINLTVW